MERKILITGASGLIGRELCKQLYKKNNLVVGVDNNFRYEHVPICNFYTVEDIKNFLKESNTVYDYIFHMGAINGTKYFYEIPNELIQNNIETDLAVFNYAAQHPSCKVIYGSSSEVVAGTDIFPTPELADVSIKNIHNPRWSYRLGKMVSENFLVNSNIDYLIVRFFNVFGPASGSGHFVRDILDKIEKNDFSLIGAEETRSFCRVEDAVDAVLNIFETVSKDIINIGSNEEITVLDAAKIIAKHKEKSPNWNFLPSVAGSVVRRNPDISKLLKHYPNFKPTMFKDAIKDL
jgi:nucleoside-diphosphate-sugar epimerase